MSKISFRFYKDHEVRAIWDEELSKWWFSVLDVVGAINDQSDYQKNRNYWKYLKTKLRKEGNELVSVTNQLKLTAADGKRYNTDVLDAEGITLLAKYTNNQRAMDFLDWFTYSDNTIDGQSRKKAYAFWESNLVADKDVGKVKSLQQIHAYLFGGLYDFAGKIRTKTISKGNTIFCLAEHLHQYLQTVENMPDTTFDEIVDKYVEMNMAHPFMEGNGRSTRIWLDLILKKRLGRCVDWSKIGKRDYLNAMIESEKDSGKICALLAQALTDRIDDREIFMKGIDYSYYYEQEDGMEVIEEGKEDNP
jgi:cell filamentation protein